MKSAFVRPTSKNGKRYDNKLREYEKIGGLCQAPRFRSGSRTVFEFLTKPDDLTDEDIEVFSGTPVIRYANAQRIGTPEDGIRRSGDSALMQSQEQFLVQCIDCRWLGERPPVPEAHNVQWHVSHDLEIGRCQEAAENTKHLAVQNVPALSADHVILILRMRILRGIMITLPLQLLVIAGSIVTVGFGAWHFFVPRVWRWYSYIDPAATELLLAVRAVNIFFSLSLVLFGAVDLIFIVAIPDDRFALTVMLAASTVLWLARTILQLLSPQGTQRPGLRTGMVLAFTLTTLCFAVPLILVFL